MNNIEHHRLPIHDYGTLDGLTRWISSHNEGLCEWIKNVRAAYQENRANVQPKDRVAIIFLKDRNKNGPARFGVLDVGGFTFDDVKKWSIWNDPDASSRGAKKTEINQGNGGKAYAYRLFSGPSYIIGVKNHKRNQVGFIGPNNSLERGLPRYYPASKNEVWQRGDKLNPTEKEKDIFIDDWKDELVKELIKFSSGLFKLPSKVKNVLEKRESFTLVVGESPKEWSGGKENVKQLIKQVLHNIQSHRAINQVNFYVIYNGNPLYTSPLKLEKIPPHPKFKGPYVYDIPEILTLKDGSKVKTTWAASRQYEQGKVTLYTSKDSMESSWKLLKPRWVVNYRTSLEEVGQKQISEIVPATPGSHYIYAKVELDALSAESVESGRRRPKPTKLVQAVDIFLAERITELAKQINQLEKKEVKKSVLDEISKENQILNKIKNEFLPLSGGFDSGNVNSNGMGIKKKAKQYPEYGIDAVKIEISKNLIRLAEGVEINLNSVLYPSIRDVENKPVKGNLLYNTNDANVVRLKKDGTCKAKNAGVCNIIISLKNSSVCSQPITLEVVSIKDVILTPSELEIHVGQKKQIVSQVKTSNDNKYSDVILDWEHDAADQNLIKISPKGFIYGNKIGTTNVKAGTKANNGIWSLREVSVNILPKDNGEKGKGGGLPTLKITDKDIDPFTGKIREGDPDAPALWQEFWDTENNVWWLNTQSVDAHFAYEELTKGNKVIWRLFHGKILVEMVIQAYMQNEFTSKQEGERPALWADHKSFYDRKYVELTKAMWEKYLKKYVRGDSDIK